MAVQCLPVMEHIGGGEVEECRICCEEYAHGSRKRILPCNHAFHPACVDLWLLGSREQGPPRGERSCPICKAPPLDSFLLHATHAYYVPHYNNGAYSGYATRVSLSDFSSSGVEYLNLADTNSNLRGFGGGFATDAHAYYVPSYSGVHLGYAARVSLSDFSSSGVDVSRLFKRQAP